MAPRSLATLVALVALAGMAPGTGHAQRPPTVAERAKLMSTMRLYVDTSNCCAVISRIKLVSAAVSTVDRRWASITIDGYDQSGREIGVVIAALHRGYLTGRWSVRSFGTSDTGCDAPVKVRRDLGLDCY